MTNEAILSHIDHTLLKPDAVLEDYIRLCEEAVKYHTASVCIPPCYVAQIRKAYPQLTICTVIGFPLGYHTASMKLYETAQAVSDGAGEIDVVINIGLLKSGEDAAVLQELKAVRRACESCCLKVIIETCFLSEEEKIRACKLVTQCGAEFIKTSTGFGPAGAALEDIALMRAHIGAAVKIKAAGGIRTREQMEAYLAAGCDRIGTSAASLLFTE